MILILSLFLMFCFFLYFFGLIFVVFFQRCMIYYPNTASVHDYLIAEGVGQRLFVQADSRTTLECWYIPPRDVGTPVVLYLQGNAGNLGSRVDRMRQFTRLGWGALFVGYRGYGGNPGSPSERMLCADALVCLHSLAQMNGNRHPLFVWGESLGCGIATRVAAMVPDTVLGLVLEAPFTSLADIVRHKLPWLRPALPLLLDRFDILGLIALVRCPLFVLVGTMDAVVPAAMSRAVYDAARAPKIIHETKAGHNDLGKPEAFDAVGAFFRAGERA